MELLCWAELLRSWDSLMTILYFRKRDLEALLVPKDHLGSPARMALM
jgi:hypothetical protein